MSIKNSFIPFEEKNILFPDTKIWIIFFILSIALLVLFNTIIQNKIQYINSLQLENKQYVLGLKKNQELLKTETDDVEFKKQFIENIYSNNLMLKDIVNNIFDLVPEKITLTDLIIKKTSLTMKGITPSKNMYKFLLGVPLRSIFDTSQVSFYLTSENNYKFTSKNRYK